MLLPAARQPLQRGWLHDGAAALLQRAPAGHCAILRRRVAGRGALRVPGGAAAARGAAALTGSQQLHRRE